ncbi:MAG TPA: diaminopimelate epimerase [Candidatus Polarisedimenticolia bacterium]|jgi:diaminopimelate epimerase|nr:diaminopimelate epimerase [Candidatus Polarisedimenticolia bacterium]
MEFFKMSGGGNDFIVVDNRSVQVQSEAMPDLVRRISVRALSVGADGVIFIESSRVADFRATFFNPDGQTTFCGNGGRCASRLGYLMGAVGPRMRVETIKMVHDATIEGERVQFAMPPAARFRPDLKLKLDDQVLEGAFIDTGVPHVVVFRDVPHTVSINEIGRKLRFHPELGPEGANANFVMVVDEHTLAVRTYERGVEGETLSCGTGCVAAALVTTSLGMTRSPVACWTRSGVTLSVHFRGSPGAFSHIVLEGDARLIYQGNLSSEATRGFDPPRKG